MDEPPAVLKEEDDRGFLPSDDEEVPAPKKTAAAAPAMLTVSTAASASAPAPATAQAKAADKVVDRQPLDDRAQKARDTVPADGRYDLTVAVTDPEVHDVNILDTYVMYTVNTKTNRADFSGTSFSVQRRFSDFDWLHDVLMHEHPNHIVAPMPLKHALKLDKFDPVFLEARRAALDRFLHRISMHPVLSHSETLRGFLTCNAPDFASLKRDRERSIRDRVSDSVMQISAKFLNDLDKQFAELRGGALKYQERLKALELVSDKYRAATLELGLGLQEVGISFGALAETEDYLKEATPSLRFALQHQAEQWADVSHTQDASYTHPVREAIQYSDAVIALLKRRDYLEWTAEKLAADLLNAQNDRDKLESSDQKSSIGALFGKDPAKIKQEKLDKNKELIASLTKQTENAQNNVAIANGAMSAEFERWTLQANTELREMMVQVSDAHIHLFETQIAAWKQVEEALARE
eukprot:m.103250 g.103250  ORF g.103250 m.103250 type:complete len:466 (-) comp15714_c0_seq2:765-2162(-)